MRTMLRKAGRRTKMLVVSALMALALVSPVALASPAQAAGPIVWTSINGGSVPMFWGTRSWSGVKKWLPNGSRFQMECWVDDQYYYGNYGSYRWFLGTNLATGYWGWVPASYVYYQTWTPHC